MSKLDIQYDILEDSPASASPVEANFNRIEQHVNQEVIERGGTVAMIAQLQLVGDPVAALDAAPKQYVDAILPVGIITMFGGVAAPPGGKWAVCNGAELESAVYPELFAIISTTYSPAGVPAGRFNLPNLADRFPVGAGTIATLGKTGGNRHPTVTKHSHVIDHGHPMGSTSYENATHTHSLNTGGTSTDSVAHAHNTYPGTESFLFGQASSGTSLATGPGMGVGPVSLTGSATLTHTHALQGSTSNQSANHVHTFTPATHTGRSGDEGIADTDITGANLPPFLGITYIMRVQ